MRGPGVRLRWDGVADRSVRASLCLLRFVVAGLTLVNPLWAIGEFGYYDPSTFDREKCYAYLEKVEASVGTEMFGELGYDHAFYLAQRMGPIDLYNVSDEAFVEHIMLAEEVGERFYREKALETEEFNRYLLPLRIRSELTTRPQWRRVLKETLDPLVADCDKAEDAVQKLIPWMAGKVKCEGDLPAYRLSKRGDLDPIKVLEEGKGGETDLAIFGVAVFRSVGVAARIVWTPTLDGMIGGKVWVEYRKEDASWDCWVPSLGAAEDQGRTLRKLLNGRAALVLTHPEAPFELTSDYLETIELAFGPGCEGWEKAVMAQGTLGIDPIYDPERGYGLPEGVIKIGRAPLLVALTRQDERYLVLPVQADGDVKRVTVTLKDGEIGTVLEKSNHENSREVEKDQ